MRSYWPRYLKAVMKSYKEVTLFHSWDKWTNFAIFRSHRHTRKMMNWSRMPKMLLRVLEDTTKYGMWTEQQTKRYIHESSVVAFPMATKFLLKYNFSLVKQSYADRGFVLFFANHRNLEVTLKPSGYGEFEEKLRKRKSRLQLEMEKHKQ